MIVCLYLKRKTCVQAMKESEAIKNPINIGSTLVSSTKMVTNMKDMLMLIWQCHISYIPNSPFVPYCWFSVPLWDFPKSSPLFSCAIFEFKFRRQVLGSFFFLLHYMISFKKLNFLNKINNMGQREYVVPHQQLPNV